MDDLLGKVVDKFQTALLFSLNYKEKQLKSIQRLVDKLQEDVLNRKRTVIFSNGREMVTSSSVSLLQTTSG